MDSIAVRAIIVHNVPGPIAVQLCEDFAEWLETKGFKLDASDTVADVRDMGHEELAQMYFDECS
jgi:hypothetical protein